MMHTQLFTRILCLTLFAVLCHETSEAGTMMASQNVVTIRLSEKEAVLVDPANQKVAMWDNAFQRILDRNMPWIEITNHSQSVAEITEFLLTLGENAMEFAFGEEGLGGPIMPSSFNPPEIDIEASIVQGGDQLRLAFTNFEPGETVRFRIDLEATDPDAHPHPDFRRVLFDGVPLSTADGEDDNALVQVAYANGDVLERRVPEFMVNPTSAMFFEGNLRRGKLMDPVQVFEFAIPEPSTWVLAAMSLALAGGSVQRRRRAGVSHQVEGADEERAG